MKNFERSARTPVRIPSKTSFGKPLCRRRGAASGRAAGGGDSETGFKESSS